ncbi:uncharacterized protein BDR25DRAFT_348276 [Lindgomyces ingoldianus]|uniref:Uncharacterized protein n=1 Tax=Lindgomyces ingoldianus TaxID=673940 RepID=A0ACB6RF60_9PLEO|nr:uncharacterized protein BDR25DRAFT_348276 [Lindgomyces ingoldianus]KAF2477979.1 hypothetical protein BDR25DRAFT_348276 [Lindgomyces ingoldianus]
MVQSPLLELRIRHIFAFQSTSMQSFSKARRSINQISTLFVPPPSRLCHFDPFQILSRSFYSLGPDVNRYSDMKKLPKDLQWPLHRHLHLTRFDYLRVGGGNANSLPTIRMGDVSRWPLSVRYPKAGLDSSIFYHKCLSIRGAPIPLETVAIPKEQWCTIHQEEQKFREYGCGQVQTANAKLAKRSIREFAIKNSLSHRFAPTGMDPITANVDYFIEDQGMTIRHSQP